MNHYKKIVKKIPGQRAREDRLKTALVSTTGALIKVKASPDEALGQLFAEVQNNQIYDDGKTFVDLIPRRRLKQIQQEYQISKDQPDFDLREFVTRHFYHYGVYDTSYQTDPDMTVTEHINELWHVLERKNRRDRGSLVALPHPYIVPGGRFSEQFYWDSFFIMLGLAVDNRWDMIEGMIKNYEYMIRKFGFIPTANRTYFLSRSQPPFFSHMIRLLGTHQGHGRVLIEHLPYLVLEYRFWMKGKSTLHQKEFNSSLRVVKMPDGTLLNRYYDNKSTPRPESMREDIETAAEASHRESDRLYIHLRAGAESGWDFSSRWFIDPSDIKTIHTADIVPVDLNCLLYHHEQMIAEAYQLLKQPVLAKRFSLAADRRKQAILTYCWDDTINFFSDYNFHKYEKTHKLTLAGVFPLYAGIASEEQATAVAERIERDFLKPGGVITTLETNGQQWDAPNGWAPLHYIVIEGLRKYGFNTLADEIKRRWMSTNMKIFTEKRKLVEKYDVTSNELGGGGEYPLQDGFGWTNGVLAALLSETDSTGSMS